jgi:hypothetical protein
MWRSKMLTENACHEQSQRNDGFFDLKKTYIIHSMWCDSQKWRTEKKRNRNVFPFLDMVT